MRCWIVFVRSEIDSQSCWHVHVDCEALPCLAFKVMNSDKASETEETLAARAEDKANNTCTHFKWMQTVSKKGGVALKNATNRRNGGGAWDRKPEKNAAEGESGETVRKRKKAMI